MSENIQRETYEIEIEGHKIVHNTYITGREARAIEGAMFNDISFTQKEGGQEFTGLNGKMLELRQDEQIKAVIVSINGNSKDVVSLVLDLPSKVSDAIMAKVTEITEPKKEDAAN